MECLIDFIGVRYTGAPVPESGLYINDLSGITVAQLSAITNSDQTGGFMDVFNQIQRRSAKMFETTFTNAMSKKFQLRKITEAFKLSETVDPATTFSPVSGELRGIYMDCFIAKSVFHHIPISTVDLYLPSGTYTNPINLNIYEVHDNKLTLLDTFAISAPVAGKNTIRVNKKYFDTRVLYIAYDASDITSASIPLYGYDLNPYLWGNLRNFFSHIFINGVRYSGGHFSESTDETFGLTCTLGLQCSFDTLVCNYKSNLAVAWWYLLGAELMKERMYTDRVNRYTTVDLDKARALEAQFRNDYMNELMTFVDSVDLHKDWCVECNAQIRHVEFKP